jgi:peptidoglycan/LPS O-acetylase OafA/YrhL
MNSKMYFPQLTGLRAVAALLVFVHHFAIAEEKSGPFLFRLQSELYIGVSVFFVLSGFLITLRYYDEKIPLRQYAVNRFARIYPMYFLVTLVTFVFYYFYPGARWAEDALGNNPAFTFFMNVTLLRGFFDKLILSGVPQGWTLTVEECFYFLAPVIFFLLRKRVKLLFLLAGFYLLGTALVVIPKGENSYGFFQSFQFMWLSTFFGRCFDFFVGVQMALWFRRREARVHTGTAWYTVTGGLLLSAAILLMSFINVSEARYPYALYTTAGLIINNWLLPLVIGIFFWGLITERTFISKILATPLFELLGRSSYTFYLIHMGVISMAAVAVVQKWIFHLPVMLILSIILYKLVEEPLNKWIRRLNPGKIKPERQV